MGLFITFEGIEGCGKTTQINLLADFLSESNLPFITTREPGGSSIGKKIRGILLDTENKEITSKSELLLYAADRTQHVETVIAPALKEGKTVLCDRFYDATTAYQGKGRGLDRKLIEDLNEIASGGLKPDLTFLIDCPVEIGIERAVKRSNSESPEEMRFEKEALTFHQKVLAGYMEIAKAEQHRIVIINGNRRVEEVHGEILKTFLNKANEHQRSIKGKEA